jgi:hypothetical protein
MWRKRSKGMKKSLSYRGLSPVPSGAGRGRFSVHSMLLPAAIS